MIIVTEFTDMDGSDLTTVTETKTYEKQGIKKAPKTELFYA